MKLKLDYTETRRIGRIARVDTIQSSLRPFNAYPNYTIVYPQCVQQALCDIFREYNKAFAPLVATNHEWETDYQYARTMDGQPFNFAVQVDMVGLPHQFLDAMVYESTAHIRDVVKESIFELENSLAMYQLTERLFSCDGKSFFKTNWRATLADLRARVGRPIALLAPTVQKYIAMKEEEFGKQADEQLTEEEIFSLSGFDHFFSPAMFLAHLQEVGNCLYALFVRASDPVEKLKHPKQASVASLLDDPAVRRIIKQHAITFNIDNPSWDMHDERKINDTKRYMPAMSLAWSIDSEEDLRLPPFVRFQMAKGIDPEQKGIRYRAKPAVGTYGGYGHLTGCIESGEFIRELRAGIRQRGAYVVQPEFALPKLTNADDGVTYVYIDRNIIGMINGVPAFLGGTRLLMPINSMEARRGRIHGNKECVFAQIMCE